MNWTRGIERGMSGADVWQVKQRLRDAGLLDAATHNRFGSDTRRAVMAFQAGNGLPATGVVDEPTWNRLFGAAEAVAPPETAPDKAKALAELAQRYIGHCYVWGASGLCNPTDEDIRSRDGEEADAQRSIRYRNRVRSYGVEPLYAFDCSGFVSFLLRELGIWSDRTDCDGLWARCEAVTKQRLLDGDLLFRAAPADAQDETHVGVYAGGGWVVHAKGRDAGVVKEGIDQNGAGYWHKFGRLRMLWEEAA